MRFHRIIMLSVLSVALSCLPHLASAGQYYTLPINPADSDGINSWFDHTAPGYGGADASSTMTIYNGTDWTTGADFDNCTERLNCYNGHNGLDYNTLGTTGKNIYAAADGEVVEATWDYPGLPQSGFGRYVRLWHSEYGQSTFYAHLDATSVDVTTPTTTVARGQKIAESGDTGVGPAHFHFTVLDGNTALTASSIDPYGWSGTSGADPWPLGHAEDESYLWTSNPPSFYKSISTSSVGANATWSGPNDSWNVGNQSVYILDGTITVNSAVTLTIDPGAIIKFKTTGSKLQVDGVLNAQGTSASKIYFTSYKDDAVGGDTNGDATSTTPSGGNWNTIEVGSGASATITNAVVRYGGYGFAFSEANLYNNGGWLSVSGTEVATSAKHGIRTDSGTSTISASNLHHQTVGAYVLGGSVNVSSSQLHDHTNYGINLSGTALLAINSNAFSSNTLAAAYINVGTGSFTHSGNTASGTGIGGFLMTGSVDPSQTWTGGDLSYVVDTVTIPSGKTLTVSPGAVLKFNGTGSYITVEGTLNARGTSGSKIYFTSVKDDSADGLDTNGTSDAPAAGNWNTIEFASGASGTIEYAIVRYGGNTGCCGHPDAELYNNGGNVVIASSTIATSTTAGLYQLSGTTTISTADIHHQGRGLLIYGGTVSIAQSSIHNNSSYGVVNYVPTMNAENNYWGASDGPSGAGPGSGDAVSSDVDYNPWLSSWP